MEQVGVFVNSRQMYIMLIVTYFKQLDRKINEYEWFETLFQLAATKSS